MLSFNLTPSIVFIFILYLSCKSVPNEKSASKSDSVQSIYRPAKITADTANLKVAKEDADDMPSLKEILEDYIKSYNESVKIDTSFQYQDKKLRIQFSYYCTFDSSVHVPELYTRIYGMKVFTTHTFVSSLKLEWGDRLITDTLITKKMFDNVIFKEERLNGVLFGPNIRFMRNKMVIHYSISIPLTDVGVPAYAVCDYSSGHLIIEDEYANPYQE